MVYDTDYYVSRRPYTSTRPTISSYSITHPYSLYDDDYYTPISTYIPTYYTPTYYSSLYYNPIRSYGSKFSTYYPKTPLRTHDISYSAQPFRGNHRVVAAAVPITRITTSPSRVYRTREVSPPPVITRTFRRDVISPMRCVTSPTRYVSIRVRPSILSAEYGRINRRLRPSPVEFDATDGYLNSAHTLNFQDETRDIRSSTRRLLQQVHEHVERPPTYYQRAQSLQPTYRRFDTEPMFEKFGMSSIDNEFHVSKNILRPTRKIRDEIEFLSKYRQPAVRYAAQILDPARASRKFSPQQIMEDPKEVLKKLKEESRKADKFDETDEIELEKIKQKRIEERQRREEQALLEEKAVAAEKAKKDAERKAELERQEKLAAEAANARQAEIEKQEKARKDEEARLAAEAKKQEEEAKLAEESKKKAEEDAKKKAEEDAKKKAAEEEAAKKKAEEAAKLAEEEAKKKAEEDARMAEEEKLAEEARIAADKLGELEKIAKEEEEVELARQAGELKELATQEVEKAEQAIQEIERSRSGAALAAAAAAAESAEETPVVEEPVVEEPVVEEPKTEEAPIEEAPVEEPVPAEE